MQKISINSSEVRTRGVDLIRPIFMVTCGSGKMAGYTVQFLYSGLINCFDLTKLECLFYFTIRFWDKVESKWSLWSWPLLSLSFGKSFRTFFFISETLVPLTSNSWPRTFIPCWNQPSNWTLSSFGGKKYSLPDSWGLPFEILIRINVSGTSMKVYRFTFGVYVAFVSLSQVFMAQGSKGNIDIWNCFYWESYCLF